MGIRGVFKRRLFVLWRVFESETAQEAGARRRKITPARQRETRCGVLC